MVPRAWSRVCTGAGCALTWLCPLGLGSLAAAGIPGIGEELLRICRGLEVEGGTCWEGHTAATHIPTLP